MNNAHYGFPTKDCAVNNKASQTNKHTTLNKVVKIQICQQRITKDRTNIKLSSSAGFDLTNQII